MPTFNTSFCRLLHLDLPIVQAPIGNATSPALVAAVSNAGGLGMLSVTWRSPDAIRKMIRETHQLTSRPFGVNLVLQWPQEERLRVCLEEGIAVVSLCWGDPSPYIPAAHAVGTLVMQTVASAAEARRVRDMGVDVCVAQGWEAGGHVWGQVATLPLVPSVVDAVAPLPVLAAGGIGDGRGIAAALVLGSAGVWLGTRFLASAEAQIHPLYQEKVLQACETDTCYSCLFDEGWPEAPHRVLRNSTVIEWETSGFPQSGHRPGEGEMIATAPGGRSMVRYGYALPQPGMEGDVEALALYAGQSVGLVNDVQSAGTLVKALADETAQALKQSGSFLC